MMPGLNYREINKPEPALLPAIESQITEMDDTPVLLLHGLFGSGDNLGTLARQLAGKHRVVLADLRNHGQSPHSAVMDLPLMAADVCALLDQLGITQCDLVGHSLGGKVAMQMAMNYPQRVRRLVIVDIAPVLYARGHDQVFAALQAVELTALSSRRDADAMMKPFIGEESLRQFLLKGLYSDATGFHWRFNLSALLSNYEALRDAPKGKPFDGRTLFIKGELSDYIADAHLPAVRTLFPQSELRVVAGAGHWLHGEQPVLFNALVESFLNT